MSRKVKVIAAITAAVFILSAIGTAIVLKKSEKRIAEVVSGGEVLYVFDLDSAENRSFAVTCADGGFNIVTIENGEIFVSDADCPDKTCIKMGKLRSENLPVVCLPHELIIRLV